MDNGYDAKAVKSFIERVESIHAEIESEKGTYMRKCKELREDIASVLDEGKDAGIPKKLLKAHIELRKLELRKESIVENLSDDDASDFEVMADALGEFAKLPLGMAAMSTTRDGQRADQQATDAADLDDLTGEGE